MNSEQLKSAPRNVVIDIWRTLAIFLVMTNHYWGLLSDVQPSRFQIVNFLECFGGEIGVTVFFILSGYGIYCSLHRSNAENTYSYKGYMAKRLNRLLPPYYLSIVIIVFLMDGAYYLSRVGLKDIAAHLLLIHNIIPSASGSINGPLWAIGVIFQFYLVAPLLYKLINKHPAAVMLMSIAISFASKYLLFHHIFPGLELSGYNFWGGRNLLPSVIDNFVIGMFLAYLWNKYSDRISSWLRKKSGASVVVMSVLTVAFAVSVYYWCSFGSAHGIHTDNVSGYAFHTVLALLCGILICVMSAVLLAGIEFKMFIFRFLRWVSEYEYAIFIWHYPLISNIISKSEFMALLKQKSHLLVWLVSFALVIAFGVLYTKLTGKIRIVKNSNG